MKMASFWIYLTSVLFCSLVAAQDEIRFPTETAVRSDVQKFGQCHTPDRVAGQCIRLKDCRSLYDVLQKTALGSRERMYLQRSQCGYHNGDILICCPTILFSPPNQLARPAGVFDGASLLPTPGVCGSATGDRIFGGKRTNIDEYPWMTVLEYTKPGNKKGFHCGGVLINNRYVLTASHCVNGQGIPSDWRLSSVRLGEWDTSTEIDCDGDDCNDPPIDVSIEEYIPHESYQPISTTQYDDIALLRLSHNVTYTEWIKPICLPISEHLRSATFDGVSLDVAGWGKTENASRSNVKLKARVDGVGLNSCNDVYRRMGVTLRNTQICAGGVKGVDSCQGDSGGPLTGLDRTNRAQPYFFLVGIASFGPVPCALEGWPGVYTRASSYVDWILSKIRP